METAIISGKGGTGKSSITAAFAGLMQHCVLADCDVDAANMHIMFEPSITALEPFEGSTLAVIDHNTCTKCGLCLCYCRFEAITEVNQQMVISEINCDGCALCHRICPSKSISMVKNNKSRLYSGQFRYGKMVYGILAPGEENSGKLVNLVRTSAKHTAKAEKINHILLDGPPGIGCPVISTITGVDQIIIVTEPSKSGLHDLKRILELITHHKNSTQVIINKSDINPILVSEMENYCMEQNIPVAGMIPLDRAFMDALNQRQTIIEMSPEATSSLIIKNIFSKIFGEF
jgi:MinD superfamily P-loop ATPase